jgi:hypothetical protein
MNPTITIRATHDHESRSADVLRRIADEYTDEMWATKSIASIDLLKTTAAQLRTIAHMADNGEVDASTVMLFIGAARRLLDSISEQARMDAVHESRASRRAPKTAKPSDTPAAKRSYAHLRQEPIVLKGK